MSSPYLGATPSGGSKSSGSPYLGATSSRAVKPQKKQGGVLHTLSQGLSDLETAAIHSPAGAYQTAKAVAHDVVHHPQLALGVAPIQDYLHSETYKKVIKPTALGVKEDVQHPLRHPGFTALDLLTAASGGAGAVARGAAVAGRLGEGARLGEALGAGVGRQALEPRLLRYQGQQVPAGSYSRSALARRVQKTRDTIQEHHPEPRVGPQLVNRVGKEIHLNQRVKEMLARAPAGHLVAAAKGLNRGQRLAIRVVAEGVPLEERISHAVGNLAKATGREARLLRKHVKDLILTRPYLADTVSAPRIAVGETQLAHVYELAKQVSGKRTQDLLDAGVLHPVTAAEAPARVGRAIRGQLGQADLETQLVPELFQNSEGFHVTYAQTPRSLFGRIGTRKTIGIPREPGSLKQFTAGSLSRGEVPANTPRVVAESLLESNRYLDVINRRVALRRFAVDARPAGRKGENYIPIRPVWLKNKPFPTEVRAAVNRLDDERQDLTVRQRAAETLRDWLHPDPDKLSEQEIKAKGIKWVDKRLLYKENVPRALVGLGQNKGVRATLAVNDSINNAERIALLYAKPAYALPNLLGNVALNVIQQGPWAVKNITRSARLNKRLGLADTTLVDAGMGEGVSASIVAGQNTGLAAQLAHWAGTSWGKVVDTAFRRSSFLHEAARSGFKTKDQIHSLLHDPGLEDTRVRVFREANENIIDYGRLGPNEQDLVRRVLFLYPWVKGSTRYSGRFLREHPFQADAAAHLAANAQVQASKDFGLPVPSWFDGYFKTAPVLGQKTRAGIVYGSNPAAAALFQTPAQLIEAGQEIVGLKQQENAYQAPGFLSPTLAALTSALTRKDSFTGYNYPANVSNTKIALEQLYGGLPQLTLYQRLHNPYAQATSPMTQRDALLQFLAGTIVPRPISLERLRKAGYEEQRGR